MARYDSLLSRSAAPLRSDMDNSMSRGMNEQNLPPNLSTDPLDFFGAIRDLVEQSIPQQDIKRYALPRQKQPQWKVEAPAAVGSSSRTGAESGLGGIVAQLEGENGTLRDRVSELERALRKAQGYQSKKVRIACFLAAADASAAAAAVAVRLAS